MKSPEVAQDVPHDGVTGRSWAVDARQRLRAELGAAMANGETGSSAADRLCAACVQLLDVDGAAVSLVHGGQSQGTFGSSGELSRRLDELQFTFGEGPCMDAVQGGLPILVADLTDTAEQRWPAFAPAAADAGVRAVYAMPVALASTAVGALDLFRHAPGVLSDDDLRGGLWAAELATLPLMDIMTSDAGGGDRLQGTDGWTRLSALQRVEVYQATGMLIAQLGVDQTEALMRLRGYAFGHAMTASEVAWQILDRRLVLDDDSSWAHDEPGTEGP